MTAKPSPRSNDREDMSGWGMMEAPVGGSITCGRTALRDGVELFHRRWDVPGAPLILLIHGLGGHSGWYIDTSNRLAAAGFSVLAPDLRGFGRSGGRRGHVRWGSTLLLDLEDLVREVAPGRRLHLLGHSMGAVLAIHLAARLPTASLGVVNPWAEDQTGVPAPTVVQVALEGLLGWRKLWRLSGPPEKMTDNPAGLAYLENDRYWVRAESASFLLQILWLRMRLLQAAGAIETPSLVVQTGGDQVVKHGASRRLFERLGSRDKEWFTPPDLFHDFQFSADPSGVLQQITGWFGRWASHRAEL